MNLDAIHPGAEGAIVRRVDDAVHVIGLRPQWAYAASASLDTSVISGPIRVALTVTVRVGEVSAGILAAGGRAFLTEKRVTAIDQETSLFLDVPDAADAEAVVLRTFEDCGRPPEIIVWSGGVALLGATLLSFADPKRDKPDGDGES